VARLFLPQSTLEAWALEDKADLKDGKLTIPAENASFAVAPAVHFQKVVSGSDERKLVSKVKTQEYLHQVQAEQMAESVIVGETAYEVITGYVAEVPVGRTADKKVSPEADLLAAFILNKL
jgi:hypothetical protein